MLGDVEFTECSQPGHDVLIGQLQYANGVAVLYGGVVSVEILQECKECVQPYFRDSNLYHKHVINNINQLLHVHYFNLTCVYIATPFCVILHASLLIDNTI